MKNFAYIDAKFADSDGDFKAKLKNKKATAESQLATLVQTKIEEG